MGVFEGGLQSSGKGLGIEGREVARSSSSRRRFLWPKVEGRELVDGKLLAYPALTPPPSTTSPSSAPSPHCTCWSEWAEAGTSSPPRAEGQREAGESQEGSRGPGTGLLGSC